MRYLKLIYVIVIPSLLIFHTILLPIVSASTVCDDRFKDPKALLMVFNDTGKSIGIYEFKYVSYWCVSENVLLQYIATEILFQTNQGTFSVFDVSDLANNHELQEVNKFETKYSGYGETAVVNNSLLYFQSGLDAGYMLHNLENGKISNLRLKLYEIKANNLTNSFDSLKKSEDSNWIRMIVTANYNNWVTYGFHDSQDMQNHDIDRNFIIHTSNQTISKTLFVKDLTNFVPYTYSTSKDGEIFVLSNGQGNQGFVTYNLFTNQSWVYNPISNVPYSTHIYGISVGIRKVWFIEYDTETMLYSLNQMALDTGLVSTIRTIDSPNAVSGFIVVNGFVFVLTNSRKSDLSGLILLWSIITLSIVILALLKRKLM